MKFRILITTFFVLSIISAFAGTRTKEEMKDAAMSVLMNCNAARGVTKSNLSTDLKEYLTREKLSIIGSEDLGFAVVTSDDRFDEVIGYSTTSFTDEMPCGFKWWLDRVEEAMENTGIQVASSRANRVSVTGSVAPFMKTIWGQDRPYNDNCTFSNNGSTYQCVTGCVATAMAQVMNYYQYPQRGTGSNSYDITYNKTFTITFSEDFSKSVYDWDKMLEDYSFYSNNQISDAHTKAVAKLMKDCGVSVNMSYSDKNHGSSSSLSRVENALKTYFGYDTSTKYYKKTNYGNDEWMNMIYQELKNKRPVLYRGSDSNSSNSGHAFVFHGYDTAGNIYVNWGWNGYCDGYYNISMLNPDDTQYNYQHGMLIAIPENSSVTKYTLAVTSSENGQVTYSDNTISNTTKNYTVNEGTNITLTFTPNSGYRVGSVKVNNVDVTSSVSNNKYVISGVNQNTTVSVTFEIVSNISFADANVKAICVENWDTDGDGELSYDEAKTVIDLGTVFKNNSIITSFEELQYFTGLSSIGDNAFYYCTKLESVKIPTSIISINKYAFYGCRSLSSIMLPQNLVSIGIWAFYNTKISSLVIPKRVSSIGTSAFSYCDDIGSIIVEEGNSVFDSRGNCNAIIKTDDNTLILGCKNTIIPNDIKSIEGCAFRGNHAITSLTIPNSVISIGDFVFEDCINLSSIVISNKLESIGRNAFSHVGITTLTIPKTVKSIGNYAFVGCKNMTNIMVEQGNTIYDSRNNCNAIIRTADNTLVAGCKTSFIENSVESIGIGAFESHNLSAIVIPNNITSIGNYAFEGCSNLKEVKVGMKTPLSITQYVFSNCRNATLYVPYGSKAAYESADYWKDFKEIVEYVDDVPVIHFADVNVKAICVENWDTDDDGELSYEEAKAVMDLGTAFKENTKIESFDELQNFTGLTAIGAYEFSGCSNLLSVTIPSNVLSIDERAFRYCRKLSSINILSSLTSIGAYAFYECSSLQSINIPSSVISIGSYAFAYCQGLASINIPTNLTTIKNYVFWNCTNLNTINIPQNVISIYRQAFVGCSSLETITVEDGNSVYDSRNSCNAIIQKSNDELVLGCKNTIIPSETKSIGSYAFSGCTGLSSLTIPNQVNSIDNSAFYNCSGLTSLSIPSSVNSIGNYSFSGCSGLTSIVVEDGNTVFDSRNNCNAIIRKSDETLVLGCKNTVIPLDV